MIQTCVIKPVLTNRNMQIIWLTTFYPLCESPRRLSEAWWFSVLSNITQINRGSLYYYDNFYVFFSLQKSFGAMMLGGICFTIVGYGNYHALQSQTPGKNCRKPFSSFNIQWLNFLLWPEFTSPESIFVQFAKTRYFYFKQTANLLHEWDPGKI